MTQSDSRPGAPQRPRINITVPPVYMAPPNHSAQYSPAHYFQHYHQQHQNPLYQPPPPSSPSRISVVIDGTNQPPDYTDYYSMYPAKAGEFVFKQFEGFKDFTMNTAKSGLGVGEKSVFWLYTKITKWSRNWFTHIFLFLMLFLYSVAGAALFIAVEGEADNEIFPTDIPFDDNFTGTHEKKMETNVNHAKNILAKNLRILALDREKLENPDPDLWEGRAINLVEEYSAILYEAYKQGSFENKHNKKTWTFWNSVFYCGTIYTTIGYGHISPSTTTGRALTIVYAIIGIPIFLIVLADFGKLFTRGIKFIWAYVRRLYYTGSIRKVRKTAQVKEVMKGLNVMYDMVRRPSGDQELQPTNIQGTEQPQPSTSADVPPTCESPATPVPETFEIDDEFNLPISIAIFILVAYMLFGATIYYTWENWSFFEAFYFVFISISTIGFGDFVPQHPIYMMCSIIYLIFGLALTSMCINVVQLKLSDSFRQASAKIGATIGLQMAEAASLQQSQSQSHVQTPVELNTVHTSTPTSDNGSQQHPVPPTSLNGDATMTPVLPERPKKVSNNAIKDDKKE